MRKAREVIFGTELMKKCTFPLEVPMEELFQNQADHNYFLTTEEPQKDARCPVWTGLDRAVM